MNKLPKMTFQKKPKKSPSRAKTSNDNYYPTTLTYKYQSSTTPINIDDYEPCSTPIMSNKETDNTSTLSPSTIHHLQHNTLSSPTPHVIKGDEDYRLDNMHYTSIPVSVNQLRNYNSKHNKERALFNSKIRGNFLEKLANRPDISKLFSEEDIKKMKNRKTPKGYQVHHKIPIQYGGKNNIDNLGLIKSDVHSLLTLYQQKSSNIIKNYNNASHNFSIIFPTFDGEVYI